jgi:hypothetical protein
MLEEQSQVEIFQLQLDKLLLFQLVTVVVVVPVAVVLHPVQAVQARWAITVAVVVTLAVVEPVEQVAVAVPLL